MLMVISSSFSITVRRHPTSIIMQGHGMGKFFNMPMLILQIWGNPNLLNNAYFLASFHFDKERQSRGWGGVVPLSLKSILTVVSYADKYPFKKFSAFTFPAYSRGFINKRQDSLCKGIANNHNKLGRDSFFFLGIFFFIGEYRWEGRFSEGDFFPICNMEI